MSRKRARQKKKKEKGKTRRHCRDADACEWNASQQETPFNIRAATPEKVSFPLVWKTGASVVFATTHTQKGANWKAEHVPRQRLWCPSKSRFQRKTNEHKSSQEPKKKKDGEHKNTSPRRKIVDKRQSTGDLVIASSASFTSLLLFLILLVSFYLKEKPSFLKNA